jgi:DNA-binding IscR family transcriptional regulator
MAHNGRFELSVRVLAVLAGDPGKDQAMHTSATIAEQLGTSAVMVRRAFSALHGAGFIVQKKGPQGGAKLHPKVAAKAIGLGDVYLAVEPAWLAAGDAALNALTKKMRQAAVAAMNETSIATVAKKVKVKSNGTG